MSDLSSEGVIVSKNQEPVFPRSIGTPAIVTQHSVEFTLPGSGYASAYHTHMAFRVRGRHIYTVTNTGKEGGHVNRTQRSIKCIYIWCIIEEGRAKMSYG